MGLKVSCFDHSPVSNCSKGSLKASEQLGGSATGSGKVKMAEEEQAEALVAGCLERASFTGGSQLFFLLCS